MAAIRRQVGGGQVLCALSGGVDSAVTAALAHRAVGEQLTCVFVDHGLLRQGEPEQVIRTFRKEQGMRLAAVDAAEEMVAALAGVVEPEEKRRIIGAGFVRIFEREAARLGEFQYLAQGTIYPDVIESAGAGRPGAQRIKTHHNVGGLPEEMRMELVEPLRFLFKDEVRAAGRELGLPDEIVYRQPFPGPGLAVRILGEVTRERLETLRAADAIFVEELAAAGLLRQSGGARDGAVVRGAAAGAQRGRDGRRADLWLYDRAAGGDDERFHDGRLGAAALRPAGAGQQPDRERGGGGEPGGVRRDQQAAGDDRVGMKWGDSVRQGSCAGRQRAGRIAV